MAKVTSLFQKLENVSYVSKPHKLTHYLQNNLGNKAAHVLNTARVLRYLVAWTLFM